MKKFSIFVSLFLLATALSAQDNQKTPFIQFSPLLSLDFSYLKVERSDWNELGIANEINSLQANNKPGFSIGLLYRFNISDQFSIAPQTIISFQNSLIDYHLENSNDHKENIAPATVALPVHFVFKHSKNERLNPVVFAGARYILNISKDQQVNQLELKQYDLAVDIGTGLDIKTNKFIFRPELIYSFGLINQKKSDVGVFNSSIDNIHRDNISLRLTLSST